MWEIFSLLRFFGSNVDPVYINIAIGCLYLIQRQVRSIVYER